MIAGPLSKNTLACYNDNTHIITVNIDHLKVELAYDILDSLCHEARHTYQRCLCDVYDCGSVAQRDILVLYNVQMFKQEFSNYINRKEDATGYSQRCESDTKLYAQKEVINYYSRIEMYLEKGGTLIKIFF